MVTKALKRLINSELIFVITNSIKFPTVLLRHIHNAGRIADCGVEFMKQEGLNSRITALYTVSMQQVVCSIGQRRTDYGIANA